MSEVFKTDYTKSSPEILVDLISATNAVPPDQLTVEKVDMSAPVTRLDGRTEVVLTAKRGSGLKGERTVGYDRVNLNQVPGIESMGEDAEGVVEKLSDVLTVINDKFKINLQPEDVMVNGKVLSEADDLVTQEFDVVQDFSLTARANSYVWMGDVAFTLTKVRQALNEVYEVTLLDGLYAPLGRAPGYVLTLSDGYWRTTEEGYIRVAENFSSDIVEDGAQELEVE